MLNSKEIRNVKFSKSMGGYKQEEVDIFLDKIEADYISYEKITTEFQQKIDTLNKEIDDYKNSQSSIQNVLLSAQKLADQIIEEAKEYLVENGELWIVIQKKQGAPSAKSKMEEVYGNCEVVTKDKGYFILKSIKR